MPGVVPPPGVPLSFLAAAALGLVACGAALIWARGAAMTDPTADPVLVPAHLGVLAALSMGVMGALHQFTPVVTQRPLRSAWLARATFVTWLGAAWLIPLGVGVQQEWLVEAGGGLAGTAVTLLVVNLSAPLAARGKGHTVSGLRFALAGFIATACFGVTYVADRSGNWFDLSGHVVLAHAVIGLFAWLGLTYVAVAEKLWPMFFLAHVPGRHMAGRLAVWLIPAGVTLLSPGLLAGLAPLAWTGAVILAAGLAAHLASLAAHIRHRRRQGGLHLIFVTTAAGFLIAGAGLALAAAVVMPRDHHAGMALAAAAVTASAGWLLAALTGHAHKVVPFILWSVLRGRGIATGPSAGRWASATSMITASPRAATPWSPQASPPHAPGLRARSPPRSRPAAGCSPRPGSWRRRTCRSRRPCCCARRPGPPPLPRRTTGGLPPRRQSRRWLRKPLARPVMFSRSHPPPHPCCLHSLIDKNNYD